MTSTKDAVAYLLKNYPVKSELSNARVTKMIYLSDWRHAITYADQITPICWYFDNYGPFVWDVKNTVESEPSLFAIEDTQNMYGQRKSLFSLRIPSYEPKLFPQDKESLDFVIEATKRLTWADFIRLIYATYPIMSSPRYTVLNLREKAAEYRRLQEGQLRVAIDRPR